MREVQTVTVSIETNLGPATRTYSFIEEFERDTFVEIVQRQSGVKIKGFNLATLMNADDAFCDIEATKWSNQ